MIRDEKGRRTIPGIPPHRLELRPSRQFDGLKGPSPGLQDLEGARSPTQGFAPEQPPISGRRHPDIDVVGEDGPLFVFEVRLMAIRVFGIRAGPESKAPRGFGSQFRQRRQKPWNASAPIYRQRLWNTGVLGHPGERRRIAQPNQAERRVGGTFQDGGAHAVRGPLDRVQVLRPGINLRQLPRLPVEHVKGGEETARCRNQNGRPRSGRRDAGLDVVGQYFSGFALEIPRHALVARRLAPGPDPVAADRNDASVLQRRDEFRRAVRPSDLQPVGGPRVFPDRRHFGRIPEPDDRQRAPVQPQSRGRLAAVR